MTWVEAIMLGIMCGLVVINFIILIAVLSD